MLQGLPNQFYLAQFIQNSILQEMLTEDTVYKTPVSLMKKHQQTFAMAMSSKYLCFGIIQQNDIAFVCYIPFTSDLRMQKMFKIQVSIYFYFQQQNTQIIGFKLIYQKQQIQIYFKNRKNVQTWIQKISKKITQSGFHQQFKPLRKIGKGGFATVYEVRRASDGKAFAVKAFSKANAFSSPSGKATLENQIFIMKILDQQNLLNLYEVFQSSNSLYLVMEIYEGGDLVTLIRRNNAIFKTGEIKTFMWDLLKGLKALQELKIMHRDIKPENIMIRNKDTQKQLVIGDFGLASQTDLPKYLLERCGTPGYVAPQVANFKPGDRLTSKCDMFSLGVIFHILVCRTHLFNGSTCDEVYKKNKNLEFDLNHPKYSCIDNMALDLMKKLLEANPDQRISARDALEHKYFWDNEDFTKANSPMTLHTSSKQILEQMVDEVNPVKQRIVFG